MHTLTKWCCRGKNRPIAEMARHMMQAKILPKYFWAEVVHTTMYILTFLPQKQGRV